MSIILDPRRETSGERLVQRPSGLIVSESVECDLRRPVGIDLFCGCGGFSLGMIQAGFEVVAACDADPVAAITFLVNLGSHPCQIHGIEDGDVERLNAALEADVRRQSRGSIRRMPVSGSGWIANQRGVPGVSHFFFGDVRKLTGARVLQAIGRRRGEVDCVFGGPPCQGFSAAGRRDEMDPRNSLVFEFTRLVLEIEPKTVAMENVPGMLSMHTSEGIPVVEAICEELSSAGWGDLSALRRALLGRDGAKVVLRSSRRTERHENSQSDDVLPSSSNGPEQGLLFDEVPA